MTPATLSVAEAAERLGIGLTLAYRLAREGELAPGIPVLKFGRTMRVPSRPLDRLLGVEEERAS